MTVETDLMRGIQMEQASSCEHCGIENDREDFVYHEGDWICPDCFAKAQKCCDEVIARAFEIAKRRASLTR
ncbi:hypothetical protein [Pseudodesulfovibrio karagichevae]|uniref:Uncharacterized protein n=1 Tax=Pseudodesulfovibrio karagichevae TaxID=3239305 RepID=A0ABV4K8F9_9BACT